MSDPHVAEAVALMGGFAERTGLSATAPPRRYLWTDAFAVCNFLGLARATGEARWTDLAVRLIDQVHHALGRHRGDDTRSGWLSGLADNEAEAHPTRGGLRIGKPLPERTAGEAYDEQLEWDRDGQYFHYLTKWMHALDQAGRATRRPVFNLWARELAEAALRAFACISFDGTPGMYWKMSIDLTRPLEPAMGQHDPLEGYITCLELRSTASRLANAATDPDLRTQIEGFTAMLRRGQWATTDPLGIGGLLSDAFRVAQLMRQGVPADPRLLEALLASAFAGLWHYVQSGPTGPAEYRLAFRELGLAIGLHAVERMQAMAESGLAIFSAESRSLLASLLEQAPVGAAIESFWLDPDHRHAATWAEHRDINEVMLATSLAPEGFLVLGSER